MNSTHELIHWRLTAMIPRIPQLEWGKKAWDSRLFPGHFLCVLNLISVSQTLILLLLFLLSCFSRVRLCATPQMAAHQAPLSRDSPGKNTGVGCHFLLQRMKVKSESEVAQSCLTLSDPMDCSLPGPWDFPGKSTGVGCHCLLLDSFSLNAYYAFCIH